MPRSPIGDAHSARLKEFLPDHAVEQATVDAAVRHDLEVAVRLAPAADHRGGAVVERFRLASELAWTGNTGGAGALLAELAGEAEATDDRWRLVVALSLASFWGRQDVDQARVALMKATDVAAHGGDPVVLADVYNQLSAIELNMARPKEALVYAQWAASAERVELSQSIGAPLAAAALAYLGRCGDAIALIDRAMPVAQKGGYPLAVTTLLFERANALAFMGELERAWELAEWLREIAASGGYLDSTAHFGVLVGEILLWQGRAASAGTVLQESSAHFAEHDVHGYFARALFGLACARARAGAEEVASSSLEKARRVQRIGPQFNLSGYLAEIELHRLAGRPAEAVQIAREAAGRARTAGMIVEEAWAVDAWMRIAPSSAVAERLGELTALTDSDLVAVMADWARATVRADPQSLFEVSRRFAAMTAWSMAADAAISASRLFDRHRLTGPARTAALAAASFAGRCDELEPRALGEQVCFSRR